MVQKLRKERAGKRSERIDPSQLQLLFEQLLSEAGEPEPEIDPEAEAREDAELDQQIEQAERERALARRQRGEGIRSDLARCACDTVRDMMAAAVDNHDARAGMVAIIQTFGASLKWSPHIHAIGSRGLWQSDGQRRPVPYVDTHKAERLFRHKVLRLLRDQGLITEERIDLLPFPHQPNTRTVPSLSGLGRNSPRGPPDRNLPVLVLIPKPELLHTGRRFPAELQTVPS